MKDRKGFLWEDYPRKLVIIRQNSLKVRNMTRDKNGYITVIKGVSLQKMAPVKLSQKHK